MFLSDPGSLVGGRTEKERPGVGWGVRVWAGNWLGVISYRVLGHNCDMGPGEVMK